MRNTMFLAALVAGAGLLAGSMLSHHSALAGSVTGSCDYDGVGAAPTVTASYDGTTATLATSGWQSREEITLAVIDSNQNTQSWLNGTFSITMDDSGSFSASATVPAGMQISGLVITGTVTQASCGVSFPAPSNP